MVLLALARVKDLAGVAQNGETAYDGIKAGAPPGPANQMNRSRP